MLKKPVKRRKRPGWYEITTYAPRSIFKRLLNAIKRYSKAVQGIQNYRFQEVSAYA